jgi:hypothetical protein
MFFYSVAQHSVLVSKKLPKKLRMQGLLHDAAEAYIGDISSPLKGILGDSIKIIERRIMLQIAMKFELPYPFDEQVDRADKRMYETEVLDLMPDPTMMTKTGEKPYGMSNIGSMDAKTAKLFFMRQYLDIFYDTE